MRYITQLCNILYADEFRVEMTICNACARQTQTGYCNRVRI